MQKPINDRTPTPVDLRTVAHIFHEAGYSQEVIGILSRAGANDTDPATATNGYTHAKEGPNDHYWRLVTAGGKWYIYYTDYSPAE